MAVSKEVIISIVVVSTQHNEIQPKGTQYYNAQFRIRLCWVLHYPVIIRSVVASLSRQWMKQTGISSKMTKALNSIQT